MHTVYATGMPTSTPRGWHSPHYCPDMVKMVAKEQVVMFALSPNTTHTLNATP